MADLNAVLDLINAFRKSKVLFSLVGLRIPDSLARVGEASVEELLISLPEPACRDSLERLLRTSVSLGLLIHDDETRMYKLSNAARQYLPRESPHSLAGYIVHSDRVLYKLWDGLQASVISGHNCWQEMMGLSKETAFSNLYRSPSDMLQFLHGMHSFATLSAESVVTAFDLSSYSHMVDLGGATGALAVSACVRYPQIRCTVVDLPDVVAAATKHFTKAPYCQHLAVLNRISWDSVDFFRCPESVPKGDLFLLSRVLHDWDDETCIQILKVVRSKLNPGGSVLIAEKLVDDSAVAPSDALLQDLNMLVQTQGRERSLCEYQGLLGLAGFSEAKGCVTNSYLDAVIAEIKA